GGGSVCWRKLLHADACSCIGGITRFLQFCPAPAGHFLLSRIVGIGRHDQARAAASRSARIRSRRSRGIRQGGGRAKPIAPAARPAPQHHHLARDAEHLGHLPDSEVVELTWFHSARSTLWKTRARIRLPAFAENDGIGRLREDTNSLKLKRG